MRLLSISSILMLCLAPAFAQTQPPLPETPGSIEYKSVSEALDALRAKSGVSFSVTKRDGWVIANDGQRIVWSFTPAGHYANPSVVRREIVAREGQVYVEMRALCQAEKEPCDRLIREFQELNERMR